MTSVLPRLDELLRGYTSLPVPALPISGVEQDSRRVGAGHLFLACQGQTGHGLKFLPQALDRGAAAVAWEPAAGLSPPILNIPCVAVPELAQRAGEIAARFYGNPAQRLFTVGVTGTDGKTSTAHLIAQALEALNVACAYVGTIGVGRVQQLHPATHTTPDAISIQRLAAEQLGQGAQALAMEVSSHALHQARVAGMAFDVAVLTNVTRDHLDYHGTVENYAAAKKQLFSTYLKGAAVLNRDDATGAAWAQEFPRCVVYGVEGDTPTQGQYVIARQLRFHDQGLSFDIDSSWGRATLNSRLLGRFNVHNLLAAVSALLLKPVPLQDAVAALAQAQTVPGRMEGFRGALAPALVVVDYAHTPNALAHALQATRLHTARQLWCVFGCGGDRDKGKRPLMAAAAEAADHLILTDDNPRSEKPEAIMADIRVGLRRPEAAKVIHDRAAAIRLAVSDAQAGDTVLIVGKGHEETQTYGQDIRVFSDRRYAAQLTGAALP